MVSEVLNLTSENKNIQNLEFFRFFAPISKLVLQKLKKHFLFFFLKIHKMCYRAHRATKSLSV